MITRHIYHKSSRLFKIPFTLLLAYHCPVGNTIKYWTSHLMIAHILGVRNDLHILNLNFTLIQLRKALNVVFSNSLGRKSLLIYAPSKQSLYVEHEAVYTFVNNWLPGLITNYRQLVESIHKNAKTLQRFGAVYLTRPQLDALAEATERSKLLPIKIRRKIRSKRYARIPSISLCVLDSSIWLNECESAAIPSIQLCDTQSNYDNVTYPIIANQRSAPFTRLIINLFSETCAYALLTDHFFVSRMRLTRTNLIQLHSQQVHSNVLKRVVKRSYKRLIKRLKRFRKNKPSARNFRFLQNYKTEQENVAYINNLFKSKKRHKFSMFLAQIPKIRMLSKKYPNQNIFKNLKRKTQILLIHKFLQKKIKFLQEKRLKSKKGLKSLPLRNINSHMKSYYDRYELSSLRLRMLKRKSNILLLKIRDKPKNKDKYITKRSVLKNFIKKEKNEQETYKNSVPFITRKERRIPRIKKKLFYATRLYYLKRKIFMKEYKEMLIRKEQRAKGIHVPYKIRRKVKKPRSKSRYKEKTLRRYLGFWYVTFIKRRYKNPTRKSLAKREQMRKNIYPRLRTKVRRINKLIHKVTFKIDINNKQKQDHVLVSAINETLPKRFYLKHDDKKRIIFNEHTYALNSSNFSYDIKDHFRRK